MPGAFWAEGACKTSTVSQGKARGSLGSTPHRDPVGFLEKSGSNSRSSGMGGAAGLLSAVLKVDLQGGP